MSNANAYVKEINSLNCEIKRLNAHLKKLRIQKREKQDLLYKYMEKNNLEKYNGITLKSVKPKQKTRRKPESAKKKDALKLFQEVGINNPENFYSQKKM